MNGTDDFDIYEITELFEKASTIRIPHRFSKNARVLSGRSPREEYLGFEISEEPVWKSRTNKIVAVR